MNEEHQNKLDQANQNITTLTEQVQQERENLIKAQKFMSAPEVQDAQSLLGEETAKLKKLSEESMPQVLKEAYAEVNVATEAYDRAIGAYSKKFTDELMQKVGIEMPNALETSDTIPIEEDPDITTAMTAIGDANKKVEDAIKARMDPELREFVSFSAKAPTEAEILAQGQARQEMLNKMAEAGTEVTGLDVTQFLPVEVSGLEANTTDKELLETQRQSANKFPVDPKGNDTFKPMTEASDSYYGKIAEGEAKVVEAETKLSKAEKNLEDAMAVLAELNQIGL